MKSGISPCLYTTGHFFGPPPSKNSPVYVKELPKKSPPRPAIHGPRADRRADPDRSPSRSPSRSDWSHRSDRRQSPTSSRSDRQRNDIHADGMTYTPSRSPIQASRSRRLDHEQRDQDRGSRIKEMPIRHRARPTKQGTRAPGAHDARDQDRGSRITYIEQRIQGDRSRPSSQAELEIEPPGQPRRDDRPGNLERSPELERSDTAWTTAPRARPPRTPQASPYQAKRKGPEGPFPGRLDDLLEN